jgi:hypothetical protein
MQRLNALVRKFRLRAWWFLFAASFVIPLLGAHALVFFYLRESHLTDDELARALIPWKAISLFALAGWAFVSGASVPLQAFPTGKYAAWLRTTAWNTTKPLPWGAVYPTTADAVGFAILLVVAWASGISSLAWILLAAFCGGYALAASLYLASDVASRLVWFGLPLVIVTWRWPVVTCLLLAGLGSLAALRLRRALSQVESDLPECPSVFSRNLGWPFDSLAPRPNRKPSSDPILAGAGRLARRFPFLFPAWTAWTAALIASKLSEDLYVPVLLAGCIPAIVRLGWLMTAGVMPMLSLRLARHRLIVPELDIVFLSPACVMLTTLVSLLALDRAAVTFIVVWPATLFVQVLLTVHGRPAYSDWQLTGPIRLVPSARARMTNTPRKALRTRP